MLALAPFAGGSQGEIYAPTAAVAIQGIEDEALISWLPGQEIADSYRVYGIMGNPILLRELNLSDLQDGIAVQGGFTGYAVSGVRDNVESRLTFALNARGDCVLINPFGPGVYVDEECIPIAKLRPVVKIHPP